MPRGKEGGAWRLLREFQADAHALVVTEERRHERKVVVAHLAEQGRSRAEDAEEFVGLEEEGNAVAVADHLGLEGEEVPLMLRPPSVAVKVLSALKLKRVTPLRMP